MQDANVMDYLHWRGDLSFCADPANEVDSLIFSTLAYVTFEEKTEAVPLSAALCAYHYLPDGERITGVVIPDNLAPFAEAAAASARFGSCKVFHFCTYTDETEQTQFAAVTFLTDDGAAHIVFRGTDDTIVGWKEDLNMAFSQQIPAQRKAAEYLMQIANAYPDKPLYLSGHSKGGNLAVWASFHTSESVQSRIVRVYALDAPGFLPGITETPSYEKIRDRIARFVPVSSPVGMLLDSDADCRFIASSQIGPFQHAPLSWLVRGNTFVYRPGRSHFGEQTDRSMRHFLASLSHSEREAFADTLYALATSSDAKTITEWSENGLRSAIQIRRALKGLDPQLRKNLMHTILTFFRGVPKDSRLKNGEDKEK